MKITLVSTIIQIFVQGPVCLRISPADWNERGSLCKPDWLGVHVSLRSTLLFQR